MNERWKEATKKAALSGLASGALLGGGGALLSGAKNYGQILKALLLGGTAGAGLSAGAIGLGTGIMGDGSPDDPEAYTKRGILGGGLGGAAVGAGLGALLASKHVKIPAIKALTKAGQEPGLVARGIEGLVSPKRGAVIGALGLGAAGGFHGAGEGMQLDFVNNLQEEQKKRAFRQALAQKMAEESNV